MRVRVVPSLAHHVGELWRQRQEQYTHLGAFNVASPLSSTPIPVYQWLVANAKAIPRWNRVTFVLMDEQLDTTTSIAYVPVDDPASYEGFARRHLLDPLERQTGTRLKLAKPRPDAIEQFSIHIHLLILALGPNGNYANVMPGTAGDVGWHVARLTPEFRQAHIRPTSQSFPGATFRKFGMSLGPRQVLEADRVVVAVSGSTKHELAQQLLSFDAYSADFPLSIIYHPHVVDRVEILMTEDVGVTAWHGEASQDGRG